MNFFLLVQNFANKNVCWDMPRSDDLYRNFTYKSSLVFWIFVVCATLLCFYLFFLGKLKVFHTSAVILRMFYANFYIFFLRSHIESKEIHFAYKMRIYMHLIIIPYQTILELLCSAQRDSKITITNNVDGVSIIW